MLKSTKIPVHALLFDYPYECASLLAYIIYVYYYTYIIYILLYIHDIRILIIYT